MMAWAACCWSMYFASWASVRPRTTVHDASVAESHFRVSSCKDDRCVMMFNMLEEVDGWAAAMMGMAVRSSISSAKLTHNLHAGHTPSFLLDLQLYHFDNLVVLDALPPMSSLHL